MLVYVDHHDAAYRWAERRRIEAHPTTGAIQIVEVRERVVEIAAPAQGGLFAPEAARRARARCSPASTARRAAVGRRAGGLDRRRAGGRRGRLLPPRGALARGGQRGAAGIRGDRRVETRCEARPGPDAASRQSQALPGHGGRRGTDGPRWRRRSRNGSCSCIPRSAASSSATGRGRRAWSGSAGTGKTVVALHRTLRLLTRDPQARVLLTTFSTPLAEALADKLKLLTAERQGVFDRATIASFDTAARDLVTLATGRTPFVADPGLVRKIVAGVADRAGVAEFGRRPRRLVWRPARRASETKAPPP